MSAFSVYDRAGYLALTLIANNAADAERATEMDCDPTRGPYRVERVRMDVARAAVADWQSGWSRDKAVDIRGNAGWDELGA